jgi:hypothetical protein
MERLSFAVRHSITSSLSLYITCCPHRISGHHWSSAAAAAGACWSRAADAAGKVLDVRLLNKHEYYCLLSAMAPRGIL